MKNIFKQKSKRTHKGRKVRNKYNSKSDIEGHLKLKDEALMDYYMMGGY